MLIMAAERHGHMSAGRGGWNTAHVRALAKRGLVRLVKEYTWDSEWKLTEEGYRIGRELLEQEKARYAIHFK